MNADVAAAADAEQFVRTLAREDRVLLDVRDELYGGTWDELERDLRARLAGKPYIFKLASRIEDDLKRIERLRGYEVEHGVDLRAVVRKVEKVENLEKVEKVKGEGGSSAGGGSEVVS